MSRPDSSLAGSEKERNAQLDHPNSDQSTTETKFSDNNNHTDENKKQDVEGRIPTSAASATVATAEHELYEPYDNGYHFPPAHTKSQSMKIGAKAFWNYTCTPLGFFVVLYGLNVVAWGGMLFLLLCNASPAMCYPTCNDINSPRRKWIEWDSQILNALFCVTGFGLAPWRFRDLYFLMQYRILKKPEALGRLAGIHRGWFRLPGSDQLPVHIGPENVTELANEHPVLHIPHPEKAIPNAPLTGVRAPPTAIWKMDFVIWFNVWNTFLQCVLSGFMWGMNRFDRPSWSTGLFVALACLAAAIGGLMMFFEGKKVKSIEGVPLSKEDEERLSKDKEMGVHHYNNIKDKKPKEEK
ncbi:hypothetical protein BDP81DRAFT_312099 [Colletotrichum phormii]|uniref:Uncharacterized protein n=1 Tax=Colletotrichum phormii TaxID=359342 RepID=A0AAJ0EKQ9_9PEZI|nr:uncharacterized protein BDP81DRAFT_312099 [Colletotrichum phormii]KAK1640271.1 hypothetical protein BDP81DRAFT_312099 [Colletotrichum phormii]